MLHSLLRLFMNRFPLDMETGDAEIDHLLRGLDRALVGTPGVRRLTLIEARDHLLEARDRHLDAGMDPGEAAARAVTDFGPIETLAEVQRSHRAAMFRSAAPRLGLAFAGWMLAFQWLAGVAEEMGWVAVAAGFVSHALLFGALMGFWLCYMFAQATPESGPEHAPHEFEVYSPIASRFAASALLVVMSGIGAIALAGLAGQGPYAHVAPAGSVLLAVLSLWICSRAPIAFVRYSVRDDRLIRRGMLQTVAVPWDRIRNIRTPVPWTRKFRSGLVYRVEWIDDRKPDRLRRLTLTLNAEMINFDRLAARLDRFRGPVASGVVEC